MNYNQSISDYINKSSKEQIEILVSLRTIIHESVAGVSEEVKWGFPVFKKTKDFTYLRFSKKHVTLGFYNFEKIEDSNNLLEGSGNTLRHIKIKDVNDIKKELLVKWFRAISV